MNICTLFKLPNMAPWSKYADATQPTKNSFAPTLARHGSDQKVKGAMHEHHPFVSATLASAMLSTQVQAYCDEYVCKHNAASSITSTASEMPESRTQW